MTILTTLHTNLVHNFCITRKKDCTFYYFFVEVPEFSDCAPSEFTQFSEMLGAQTSYLIWSRYTRRRIESGNYDIYHNFPVCSVYGLKMKLAVFGWIIPFLARKQ